MKNLNIKIRQFQVSIDFFTLLIHWLNYSILRDYDIWIRFKWIGEYLKKLKFDEKSLKSKFGLVKLYQFVDFIDDSKVRALGLKIDVAFL